MNKPMLAQDFHKDLSQRKIKKYEEEYEGDVNFNNLYSVQDAEIKHHHLYKSILSYIIILYEV